MIVQNSLDQGSVKNFKGFSLASSRWPSKNTRQETSRDRYMNQNLSQEIADLESQLAGLGFGKIYCEAIRRNVTKGRDDAHAQHLYRTALERTVKAKSRAAQAVDIPY